MTTISSIQNAFNYMASEAQMAAKALPAALDQIAKTGGLHTAVAPMRQLKAVAEIDIWDKLDRVRNLWEGLNEIQEMRVDRAMESWVDVEVWTFIQTAQKKAGQAAKNWSEGEWTAWLADIEYLEPNHKLSQCSRMIDEIGNFTGESGWSEVIEELRRTSMLGENIGKKIQAAQKELQAALKALKPAERKVYNESIAWLNLAKQA